MKIRIPLLALLFSIAAYGCSDHSTGSEPEESVGPISGTYSLIGQQINLRFCYLGAPDSCIEGEVVARDTTETSFEVEITVVEEKTDTLFFAGLDRAGTTECTVESDCPYAKLTGETLEFDINYWGHFYFGNGTLSDGFIKLETRFRYRGMGVDYHLKGEKIEEYIEE